MCDILHLKKVEFFFHLWLQLHLWFLFWLRIWYTIQYVITQVIKIICLFFPGNHTIVSAAVSCRAQSLMGLRDVAEKSGPFLYPCTIEYSLIAAGEYLDHIGACEKVASDLRLGGGFGG